MRQRDLHGESGALVGHELLAGFALLGCSGTLLLEHESGLALIVLAEGAVRAQQRLGPDVLGQAGLRFQFNQHAPDQTPRLPSCFPTSVAPLLRALPALNMTRLLRLTDLQTLLGQLREDAFSGLLLLETLGARGLALFAGGKLAAALLEEDGFLRERTEALRALRRAYVGAPEAQLWLRPLETFFVASLVGLASGTRARASESFSGLEAGDQGYRYLHEGRTLLLVEAELRGAFARYALPETLPELSLPDEPPGWEERRFMLTLRGRDALNPMTEVALEFQRTFGRTGRQLLEGLDRGVSVEGVAQLLTLELTELRPWIGKLEQEGLVRPLQPEARSPTR